MKPLSLPLEYNAIYLILIFDCGHNGNRTHYDVILILNKWKLNFDRIRYVLGRVEIIPFIASLWEDYLFLPVSTTTR